MPKVSVIVPVYNDEKRIKRCLDSILAQTFSDFELILIDDGSTDSSGMICDEYSKKDSRVITIHKSNTGVSDARNVGLKNANGDLITFIDSDDYCMSTLFEHAVENFKKNECDLLISGYIAVDDSDHFLYKKKRINQSWYLESDEKTIEYIIEKVLSPVGNGWEVWSSFFNRTIIIDNNIEFCKDCNNFAEDLGFMLEYLLYCNVVIGISNCDYRYVRHSGSMMDESKYIAKLDSVNEIAIHFGKRFFEKVKSNKNRQKYAIVYYLIMDNQYSKLKLYDDYKKALEVDKQIRNIAWHDKWMKKLVFQRRELERVLGSKNAKIAILNSRLVAYRNRTLFSFESYITWKFLIKDES